MNSQIKVAMRGMVYMFVIASVFGYWQDSWTAGLFMLLFLWFLEKMVRALIDYSARILVQLDQLNAHLNSGITDLAERIDRCR